MLNFLFLGGWRRGFACANSCLCIDASQKHFFNVVVASQYKDCGVLHPTLHLHAQVGVVSENQEPQCSLHYIMILVIRTRQRRPQVVANPRRDLVGESHFNLRAGV